MAFDIKGLLKQIAPVLATVFGGPAAGVAVKVLSETLLGKQDGTQEEVATALLNATPEQLLAVKKAEQEFAVKMGELGLDWDKLEHEEKQSARELFKTSVWPQILLSGIFVTGYFATLILVIAKQMADVPEWQQAVITTIFGVLTAAIPQILGFWFGSSFGSARKTQALALSVPALNGNGNGGPK
jgi:hypothetical protein